MSWTLVLLMVAISFCMGFSMGHCSDKDDF